jgi:hypothetical protein
MKECNEANDKRFHYLLKTVAASWKSIPESDKKPYQEQAKQLKEEYKTQVLIWKSTPEIAGELPLTKKNDVKKKVTQARQRNKAKKQAVPRQLVSRNHSSQKSIQTEFNPISLSDTEGAQSSFSDSETLEFDSNEPSSEDWDDLSSSLLLFIQDTEQLRQNGTEKDVFGLPKT